MNPAILAAAGWGACTALACGASLLLPAASLAGPVLCTTSLEAPLSQAGSTGAGSLAPVEVTRCGVIQTTSELMQRRYYSYRAPFARGVSLTHQVTDLLGIAMGGGDGTRVMGLGFPDQSIIWDGSAIANTTRVLMEDQSDPILLRTSDLPSLFNTSLASSPPSGAPSGGYAPQPLSSNWIAPVRGLW